MTKEKWAELNYVGKHEKRKYVVWRVLGPAGPTDTLTVLGLDAVKEAISGCWDWEVTDPNGKEVRI